MVTRSFETLLAKYPAVVQSSALTARKLILELLPDAEETVDDSDGVVGYGYGPGYNGLICTLLLSKSGVKLGIVRGAELSDPDGLLEGSGKVHRYVQLRTASDLQRPGLRRLVKTASAAWKDRARVRSAHSRSRK
jgi:hypothetical protein